MKTRYLIILIALFAGIFACKEEERFGINSDDSVPPGQPTLVGTKRLNGGARIFYKIPSDKDLLSINAEYVSATGKTGKFSASYFKDSLDVYGMTDTVPQTIQLYAVDRAGNKSESVPVSVTPMESVISLVAKSVSVKPGFSSFFVDWTNELAQSVKVFVDFNFTQNGVFREYTTVFSSNALTERRFINDLALTAQEPVSVKVRVEDIYDNMTAPINMGSVVVLQDEVIPKDKWLLPNTGDSVGGQPQFFSATPKTAAIDGIIDDLAQGLLYTHTNSRGRTGNTADGNVPWNILIDLGDYYELSRVLVHQRRQNSSPLNIGLYFGSENVGRYNIHYLDKDTGEWVYCSQRTVPIPTGVSDLEKIMIALAGDMAYFYPDDPKFTKPARWFRYEAIAGFGSNYTATNALSLCEITLYGKKK
ncbi:MAG: DUF4959 domain-containing protein [Prevotellaceae bacterium]|nr:DUF4959 domain-containing protein [Prevotellaceae bacterium]